MRLPACYGLQPRKLRAAGAIKLMIRETLLNGLLVQVDDKGHTRISRLGCDRAGAPEGTEGQAATARELGYGDDVAAMVADHDPLHARLCDWLGLADSEALFGGRPEVAAAEEAAVLAVQKFMRLAGGRMPGARR